ncbi:mandelate racemase/muconate lactonizing enzyme family protein [Streptomyces thinghirensis]|nr:mandelate racemase/muconate lactonizing enzyme family protein [Streptomyces thinghirensis]
MRPVEEQVDYLSQNVSRASKPSQLKITDLREAVLDGVPLHQPHRPHLHQSGHQRLRRGARRRGQALRPRTQVPPARRESLQRRDAVQAHQAVRQPRRRRAVVCPASRWPCGTWPAGVRRAGVRALGGAYRKKIRLYTDTTESENPRSTRARMKDRVDKGFTYSDGPRPGTRRQKPGTVVGRSYWDDNLEQYNGDPGSYGQTHTNFTMVQLTDKGLEMMAEYVEAVRDAIGYDIPMGMDHTGHFDVNTAIRLANRSSGTTWRGWKTSSRGSTPRTGRRSPRPSTSHDDRRGHLRTRGLPQAVRRGRRRPDQPDPATAGGILETKRIGDYAAEKGQAMPLHYAGSPVGAMASAHIAAGHGDVRRPRVPRHGRAVLERPRPAGGALDEQGLVPAHRQAGAGHRDGREGDGQAPSSGRSSSPRPRVEQEGRLGPHLG